MKLVDLTGYRMGEQFFSMFERYAVDVRKDSRAKYPGRTMASIKRHPKLKLLTVQGIVNMNASERDMTLVSEHILIGGRTDAEHLARMLEYGITHVLNTTPTSTMMYPQRFVYLKVAILDNISSSILDTAQLVTNFLSHVEKVGGRVLVNCGAGVSCSAALVLLHMIKTHRITLNNAFNYLVSCRDQISPNDSFKFQLASMELQELGYSSVARRTDRPWDFFEWNNIKRTVPTSASADDDGDGENSEEGGSSSDEEEESETSSLERGGAGEGKEAKPAGAGTGESESRKEKDRVIYGSQKGDKHSNSSKLSAAAVGAANPLLVVKKDGDPLGVKANEEKDQNVMCCMLS